jgi:hypothetical protein
MKTNSLWSLATSIISCGIGLCLLAFPSAAQAQAHSGHTAWRGWDFNWEIKDGAGLAIRNVRWKEEQIIYKASMPVIRVRYDGNVCGPYQDRLDWYNLIDIPFCANQRVCQRGYTDAGGRNWCEIGVLAAIGAYRLYQAYYFSDDGYIQFRCWSRGLHCNKDHDHHMYWRIDFDIGDAARDQVFVYDNNRPNNGWGPGWLKYTTELNTLKNPGTSRQWFVRDNNTGHGCWLIPGPDGTATAFSTKDTAPRLYHGMSEDAPWAFGAGDYNGVGGHLGYLNGEDIQEKDVVVWYVAHLRHIAADGENHWAWDGPLLKVQR